MNFMDHAGWIVVAALVNLALGAWLHWLFTKNNCERCGLAELKAEISRLCNLVESLWEKAGLTVKERLELEGMRRE